MTTQRGMECWASTFTLTFGTTTTAEFSALRAGRTLPQENSVVLISVKRPSGLRVYWMRTEGLGHLKTANDPTGNRTRNLPSFGCSSRLAHFPGIVIIRFYATSNPSSYCRKNRTSHTPNLRGEASIQGISQLGWRRNVPWKQWQPFLRVSSLLRPQ